MPPYNAEYSYIVETKLHSWKVFVEYTICFSAYFEACLSDLIVWITLKDI